MQQDIGLLQQAVFPEQARAIFRAALVLSCKHHVLGGKTPGRLHPMGVADSGRDAQDALHFDQ